MKGKSILALLVVTFLVLAAPGCPKPPAVVSPSASFSADVDTGKVPLEVHFTNLSNPGSSAITAFQWDFGDGEGASVENPSHTYADPGAFTVTLTVTSSVGTDSEIKTDYIRTEITGADYQSGTQIDLVVETVGQEGMELAGPAGSPIDGVRVIIPPAVLQEDTVVTLGYETGTLTPVEGQAVGPVVSLDIPVDEMFEQPIQIVLPYPVPLAATEVPVAYYIDDTGSLSLVELADVDEQAGALTIMTFHASRYGVVITDEELCEFLIVNRWFEPVMDGFKIENKGSSVSRGGECLGMTAWALWYYLNHKSEGVFYPRFMFNVDGVTGQDIIATRAFTSVTQMHYINTRETIDYLFYAERKNAAVIRNAMANTGKPVLLRADDDSPGGGAHSLLAYAYRIRPGLQPRMEIDVYDPNIPGIPQLVTFNSDENKWNYRNYTAISFYGDGSLKTEEPFENILEDANSNFHSSRDAVIDVQSHSHNDSVTERVTTLSGKIESGEIAVTELRVAVNSDQFTTTVGYDGYFSLEIPIHLGNNYIVFLTSGKDAFGNKRFVNNNYFGKNFILKGTFDQAVIRVTLSWDKDYTDLDLYVIDPNGDASWYMHKITADGGELDYDDTSSRGPEHWTLTTSDTVRWNQNYVVRVHYFRDNDHGPTNYTVSIVLYEGTLYETTRTIHGVLSENDINNADPAGTGPDWANIAVITPIGPKSLQAAIRPAEPDEPLYVDPSLPIELVVK